VERYRRLQDLLASGQMKARVIPRDDQNVFVLGIVTPEALGGDKAAVLLADED
jgi:hypothetical protein